MLGAGEKKIHVLCHFWEGEREMTDDVVERGGDVERGSPKEWPVH